MLMLIKPHRRCGVSRAGGKSTHPDRCGLREDTRGIIRGRHPEESLPSIFRAAPQLIRMVRFFPDPALHKRRHRDVGFMSMKHQVMGTGEKAGNTRTRTDAG